MGLQQRMNYYSPPQPRVQFINVPLSGHGGASSASISPSSAPPSNMVGQPFFSTRVAAGNAPPPWARPTLKVFSVPKPPKQSSADDTLTSLNWLTGLGVSADKQRPIPALPPTSPRQPTTTSSVTTERPVHLLQRSLSDASGIRAVPGPTVCNVPPAAANEEVFSQRALMQLPNSVKIAQQKTNQRSSTRNNAYCTYYEAMNGRHNPAFKPPYSYSTLICMAMRDTARGKLTLSDIYQWVKNNFAYYRRLDDTTWQNSIRHNLSLNKAFQKLPKNKTDMGSGKGSYWCINPSYNDLLVDGIIKKRRYKNRDERANAATTTNANDTNSAPNSTKQKQSKRRTGSAAKNSITKKNSTVKVKPEPPMLERSASETTAQTTQTEPELSMNLLSEFNLQVLMNEVIEVDGVKIKTEQIVNDFFSMPSPSNSNSTQDSERTNIKLERTERESQTPRTEHRNANEQMLAKAVPMTESPRDGDQIIDSKAMLSTAVKSPPEPLQQWSSNDQIWAGEVDQSLSDDSPPLEPIDIFSFTSSPSKTPLFHSTSTPASGPNSALPPSEIMMISPRTTDKLFDELLCESLPDFGDLELNETAPALDFTTHDPLDLTIQGVHIEAPNWWDSPREHESDNTKHPWSDK